MHCGTIAADVGMERLLLALAAAGNVLERLGRRRGDQDVGRLPLGVLAGVERGGRTYILDSELALSTDEKALVATSGHASCVIAAAMVESASGTGSLIVADRGRLVRLWLETGHGPRSEGEMLASEQAEPLDTVDGAGQWAALRSLGFEPDAAWEANDHELLVSQLNWEDAAFRAEAEAQLRGMGGRPRGLLSRLLGRGKRAA